ncbi:hypothetical protein ACMZ49_13475 [Alcaligenes phenolicus]
MLFSTGRGTSKQSENHAAMNYLQKEAWIADELYLGRSNPSFQKLFQLISHQLLLFFSQILLSSKTRGMARKKPTCGRLFYINCIAFSVAGT